MRKGILLLVLFFALSALVTLALSVIMKPESFGFLVFLYIFATSQLFLFLHSLLYWYYTARKTDVPYPVDRRSDDFDKKTLVIVSAFSEDEEVLVPTFDAVKQSFTGPVMLAVDAPKNVRSYIELCKRHGVICLHRIHRSGFKAGAINNVVLNFLKHQHGYITQTRRDLADEVVLNMNQLSKLMFFELSDTLTDVKKTLSNIDVDVKDSSNNYIHEHVSKLVSDNREKQTQPKDLIMHSKIMSLDKKIDNVARNYGNSWKKLSSLHQMIIPINNGIGKLSSDIESLQLETKSAADKLSIMQTMVLISKTDECIKKLTNEQISSMSSNQKNKLFSMIADVAIDIDNVHSGVLELKKSNSSNSDNSTKNAQTSLNHNNLQKLQSNLKSMTKNLTLLCEPVKNTVDNQYLENYFGMLTEKQKSPQQPMDLDLWAEIKVQRDKIDEIDDVVESLYGDAKPIMPSNAAKLFHLEDLKLSRSNVENLEKKLSDSETQANYLKPSDLESLRAMVKIQRGKLDEIDGHIESLYAENLYDHIQSISFDGAAKLFHMDDLVSLHDEIDDLQKDMNEFYDVSKSLNISSLTPGLEKILDNINDRVFHPEKFLPTNDMEMRLDKVEDLISEFNYTVDDLKKQLPLDIEYIVLLDSDAHPKPNAEPQNNFFDLCAKHIQENDLLVFPQFYDKDGGNLVRAAYAQQVPFMKTIMPKRGEDNTAFMLGTNIMVKKSMLESVNGFDDSTVTEDLATSMKMHEESNAKSKYINKDVVVNGAPFSISGYFTQQQRWAYGTYQIFCTMLLRTLGNDLPLKRYVQYIYGNTWYFYGLTFVINALIPFYSVFWEGLIQIPEEYFFLLYLPYVFTGIIIFFYSVLRTGHGLTDVFYNMSLNAICFYTYIKALVFILIRKSLPFEVTPKSGSSEEATLRFKKILPVLVVMGLLGSSIVVNSIRIATLDVSAVHGLINIIWASFFIALLSPVMRFD